MITVVYDTGYETTARQSYQQATWHVDESGTLYIQKGSRYVAAYGKNVWRTVNED